MTRIKRMKRPIASSMRKRLNSKENTRWRQRSSMSNRLKLVGVSLTLGISVHTRLSTGSNPSSIYANSAWSTCGSQRLWKHILSKAAPSTRHRVRLYTKINHTPMALSKAYRPTWLMVKKTDFTAKTWLLWQSYLSTIKYCTLTFETINSSFLHRTLSKTIRPNKAILWVTSRGKRACSVLTISRASSCSLSTSREATEHS